VYFCRHQLAAREGPCDSEWGFGFLPFLHFQQFVLSVHS
jgi:hypothetical protein